MENRTVRLTLLVDPQKKAAFENLCTLEDTTVSQKIRQLMREYIESRLGPDWQEQVFADGVSPSAGATRSGRISGR